MWRNGHSCCLGGIAKAVRALDLAVDSVFTLVFILGDLLVGIGPEKMISFVHRVKSDATRHTSLWWSFRKIDKTDMFTLVYLHSSLLL